MDIIGIVLVSFICTMFIHLGLGETLCKVLHFDFILFRCTKCLNFWMVLSYALFFTELSFLWSLASAFAMSYTALWLDLGLAKLACRYDYWYSKTTEDLDPDTDKEDSGETDCRVQDGTEKEKKDTNRFLS